MQQFLLIFFREIQRTQGVSTTDLVGRMLLMTRNHFQKGESEYSVGKDGKRFETCGINSMSKFKHKLIIIVNI